MLSTITLRSYTKISGNDFFHNVLLGQKELKFWHIRLNSNWRCRSSWLCNLSIVVFNQSWATFKHSECYSWKHLTTAFREEKDGRSLFLLRVKDKIKGQKDRVGTERKYWVIWLVIGNLWRDNLFGIHYILETLYTNIVINLELIPNAWALFLLKWKKDHMYLFDNVIPTTWRFLHSIVRIINVTDLIKTFNDQYYCQAIKKSCRPKPDSSNYYWLPFLGFIVISLTGLLGWRRRRLLGQ